MKYLKTGIGFLISFLMIYLVLYKPEFNSINDLGFKTALLGSPRIGFADLKIALKIIDIKTALMGLLVLTASLFLKAWRWQLIINQIGHAKYWTVFHTQNTGLLLNAVLPLRAGELIRGVVIARRSNINVSSTLTSVVVERIFDLASLAVCFGLIMISIPFPPLLKFAGGLIALVSVAFIIVSYFLSGSSERINRWHDKAETKKPFISKLMHIFINLVNGLSVLRSGKAMFHIAWSSMFLWVMYFAVMRFVMSAFQLLDGTYPLLLQGHGWIPSAAMAIITALGFAIPSAPGGIGTYHASVLLGLALFNVPENMGVIFGTTMHAANFLITILLGGISYNILGLKFSDLVRRGKIPD
jgi:glycosyltransferase 2 family protein